MNWVLVGVLLWGLLSLAICLIVGKSIRMANDHETADR